MSEITHSVYCAANGCPSHGSMSTGTGGGSEWYCALHFRAQPGKAHAITNELMRLEWLVKITQRVRAAGGDVRRWLDVEPGVNQIITLNQSSHLLRADSETMTVWLTRLEGVLAECCKSVAAAS